jgi:ubiquitin carboxyl-terminal hydrolase 9/24
MCCRFEAISPHIRNSAVVRRWFAQNALLSPQNRLAEYILVASSLDIRAVFVKIIVFFCHFASQDEPLPNCDGSNLCEQVLLAVLKLLVCEAADYGKHLPHFFNLFVTYALLGVHERHQLLKVSSHLIRPTKNLTSLCSSLITAKRSGDIHESCFR